MAVKAGWQEAHHAYLAFSFPSEGSTSVLDITGLDPNCSSLLLDALPGGWLAQVTHQVGSQPSGFRRGAALSTQPEAGLFTLLKLCAQP